MPRNLIKTGDTFTTNQGFDIEVIQYDDARNVHVRFDCGYVAICQADNIRKGGVSYPFRKSVYGVGFKGNGKYKTKINNKQTDEYERWKGILRRCYSPEFQEKNPTYKGCYVVDEWHDFQVFAEWFNTHNVPGYEIDKDLIVKWNNAYGPEYCSFVPVEINAFFTDHRSMRGCHPIGVSKDGDRFVSSISIGKGKRKKIGRFSSADEAFAAYKNEKESIAKELAIQYKDSIHPAVFENLMTWDVVPFPELHRIKNATS